MYNTTCFDTPILFINFNRPSNTARVFEKIQERKPRYLFVFQDGPRNGNVEDIIKCKEVRAIFDRVDWDCELRTNFSGINLGCGKGPATAITWFFNNVEAGIILEDDCLPHLHFFDYCAQLLLQYKNDVDVAVIGGANFLENVKDSFSYRFTAYAEIWGWATWKRVWDKYDYDFNVSVSEFRKQVKPFLRSKNALKYWCDILEMVQSDQTKSYWDYQMHLKLMYNHSIHILPNVNLISNIGFGDDSTHTTDVNSIFSNKAMGSILPIQHPAQKNIQSKIDNKRYKHYIVKLYKRKMLKFVTNTFGK